MLINFWFRSQETITCPTCNGQGRGPYRPSTWPRGFWTGELCRDCNGRGLVPVEIEPR